MTYVVLVILIALWALVLLPPYLKDRRSSSRAFAAMQRGGLGAAGIGRGTSGGAQRFLPLQQANVGYATGAVAAPTGIRATPPRAANSNVVHLRPPATSVSGLAAAPAGDMAAAAPIQADPMAPVGSPATTAIGVPQSKAAARERRRHVLMGLTGVAFVTLLLALTTGGLMVAIHVLVDVVMLGYVILLVRHRQLEAEQSLKIEPIRPPVTEQAPASVQVAPAYLLRSGT